MSSLPAGPRYLYLHGFASGPNSTKGVAFTEHFAARGVNIERLSLRLPSLEQLRVSAGIAATRVAIGGARDRAVLLGSSLGGLTAARLAEQDARVCALVLLAPAFQAAERWRARLAGEPLRRWRETGWMEIQDFATRQKARIDYRFLADLETVDPPGTWPDLRVPTLIVHGRRDEVVDVAGSRAFAAGRRNVRLVEVEDGHELIAALPGILGETERFLAPFLGQPAS